MLDDASWMIGTGSDAGVRLGLTLDMVNAMAAIGTAVALFTVLRRVHEGLILGFVTTRLLEAAIIAAGVASAFAAVTLRTPGATGAEAAMLISTGDALIGLRDWTFVLGPGLMPAFNALLLGTILFRSGLVPRWIPALGLIGGPLLLSSTIGMMLGINELGSAWSGIATAPIFVWELSVGLWMMIKGFRSPALTAMTAGTGPVRATTTPAGAA